MLGFADVSIHDACHSQGVLAQILGGGIASRLFMEIRKKRSLFYSVYASPSVFCDCGSTSIYNGTGCDEIAELVPVLCDELNKVRGTVTADEVERIKRQLKAGLAHSQESPMRRAERSANQFLDYGRVIPVAETMAKIDAVMADSVMAVAKRIFRSRPAVAAVVRLDKLEAYDALAARLAAWSAAGRFAAGRFKDRPRRGSFPDATEAGELIMTALIKVTVTAMYRGKSYTGKAEVEVERLDQKYMIAHMDLIRDLPAGREGERVPLRDRDFDAGTLAWSPDGWCYEPPEFSDDEQHLLRRLANDACRYGDCRGATLDHLRTKGLATWTPTTGRPTVDHCWVSLTKAGFDAADRLFNRQ